MKNKNICYSSKIVYLIASYPLLPVFSSTIQPANDKTQLTVKNQIPIINIAAPNQAGISHNHYQQFNIPPQGAVLNNAIQSANSELAGQLAKNEQLTERAASLIIHEVTGSSSSQLNGKLEIAGKQADVIIANPNGISCDGCHFSNIGGLTLTTGQPTLNQQGEFSHIRVKKGDITFRNKGLNSGSQNYTEMISQTATINASIHSKNISLLQGTNAIDYQTGTVSQITNPSLKPQFAVNITALGGIYANRVKIIATEPGSEVKLDNIKTSERDLFVSAKGKLTLGHITTKGHLTAKAPAVIIPATSEIVSQQDLLVESDSLINQGKVTAQQNMHLFSNIIHNQGKSAKIEAYNHLWLQKNARGELSERIENSAATISTQTGDLFLRAKHVINQTNNPDITQQLLTPDSNKVKEYVVRAYGHGAVLSIKLKPNYQINGKQRWFGEIDPLFTQFVQLEKTTYTLASPLVIGRISAGNNLYIKSDQLVNDKSIIKSRNDSYLHSKNITAISQKLGEKSAWVAMHNALDKRANYVLLQGSLHQIFGYIPEHHAYQKNDYEDARIRYFVDYGQYLSFIPADIAEKAPYESFIYDSATHLIPVNQPEIGLWRDQDFLAARFSATNNLVISADNLQYNKNYPHALNSVAELHEKFDDKQLLVGKNITLNSKQLTGSLSAQAQNNLLISSENIVLNNSELSANNELNLIARNDIALTDTGLAGHNVLLLSKNGAIRYQAAEYQRYDDDDFWQYDLLPDEDLLPYFDIAPKYKLLAAKNRLDMIAGQDIQIDNKVALNVPIINITTKGSIYFNRPGKALFNKPLHYDRLELNLKSIYDFHDKEYNHQRDLETSEQYQPKWQKARHILLNAGKDIVFNGLDLEAEQGIEVFAGNDIQLAPAPFKLQDNFYLLLKRRFTNLNIVTASFYSPQLKLPFDLSSNIKSPRTQAFKSYLTSEGTLLLNAGRDLNLQAAELSSKQATHLFAGRNIDLSVKLLTTDLIAQKELEHTYQPQSFTPVIQSGGALHMVAGENLFLQAANIKSGGAMALTAGNEFVIDDVPYRAEIESDGYYEKLRHLTTQLHSGGRLDLFSKQHLLIKGAQLHATGDLTLVSAGNTELKALKNRDHGWQHGKLIDKTYQQGVEIQSGGALNILAGGHLLFQAANLKAQRTMDIAAQGGYLYAQAMEETEHYEEKRKSCNRWTLCLTKNSEHRTYHAVKNRVTEFHAGNDISLLSYNDSIYEATKINTQRNATLTSSHGRVLFKAVQNQTLNQTISNSKDIFITRRDKGSYSAVWQLPTIQYGGELTVNAAQGIEADVNGQKGQTLKQVIASLGDSPESQWLKVLQNNPDVNWHKVENVYKSWDITQQQLHPVSAAVIAIATGAAASALAIPAGISAASAAGLSGTSAIVMQGAVSAGVRAIAAKAAVSLASNQGDISATLKELGSSQSVKSIIASMAIEGSLAGLDTTVFSNGDSVAHSAQPYNPTFPRFSDGEWQHTVQRVAAQSLITSGVDTALNGGSFKDKLAAALVSQTSRQLHAEGAHLIAKNGQVLGNPGKLLSHGAMAALSAEIADSDKVGAAAGAFAAELAAIGLGDNYYVDSSNRQQKILDTSRVIGGLAGALASGTAEGAYSGADAGVIAVQNNFLSAKNVIDMKKELEEAERTGADKKGIYAKYGKISQENKEKAIAEIKDGTPFDAIGVWEELNGGVDLADSLKWATIFADLSAEDQTQLTNFVKAENGQSAQAIYQSLPTTVKIALQGKEIAENAGVRGAVAGSGISAIGIRGTKSPYQPNQDAVGNMSEFFRQPGFGSEMKGSSQKTSQVYQGQSVYQASNNIGTNIKKGDQYYLDGQHKNHLELFDKRGDFKAVLNLDGTINQVKTEAGKGRKL